MKIYFVTKNESQPIDDVWQWVEKEKKRLDINTTNLIGKSGVSRQAIYNIRNGVTKMPEYETLAKIAAVFGGTIMFTIEEVAE